VGREECVGGRKKCEEREKKAVKRGKKRRLRRESVSEEAKRDAGIGLSRGKNLAEIP